MSRTGRELYDEWRAGGPDRWESSSDKFRGQWNQLARRHGEVSRIDVSDRVAELDPGFHNVGPDENRTDFKGFGESISDFEDYEGMKRIDPKRWEIPRFEVTAEETRGKTPLSDEQIADKAGATLHQMLVELLDEPEVREALLEHIFGSAEDSEPENLTASNLRHAHDLSWLAT